MLKYAVDIAIQFRKKYILQLMNHKLWSSQRPPAGVKN